MNVSSLGYCAPFAQAAILGRHALLYEIILGDNHCATLRRVSIAGTGRSHRKAQQGQAQRDDRLRRQLAAARLSAFQRRLLFAHDSPAAQDNEEYDKPDDHRGNDCDRHPDWDVESAKVSRPDRGFHPQVYTVNS